MRSDIHLFIGGKEVEFNGDPKILFNFKETELHNPTIIRNSWTKTVTVPSTPSNDDIFNHFWNLERTNDFVDFNPMMKSDFELYINNTLIQNGYCKLDSVKTSNHKVEYQISLFGGLGDFFYNLSYDEGDVANNKKTLASLNLANGYWTVFDDEPNLDITINKETIKEAWDALTGQSEGDPDDKWNVINFAPCYNGIPADFDASKALANNVNLDTKYFYSSSSGDSGTADYYTPMLNGAPNLSGYSLIELNEELTCDETRDLRSYLQRPVVNVNRIIRACTNPVNNGGYQVILDDHFFNFNNPYFYGDNAWVTLPMLRDLDVEAGTTSEEISGATVTNVNQNRNIVNFSATTLSELNNVRLKVNVGLDGINTTASTLYSYFDYTSNPSSVNGLHVKYSTLNVGATFMLFARDSLGRICAQSKAYCLSTNQYSPDDGKNVWADFNVSGYPKPSQVVYKQGKWVKRSGQWIFTDMSGNKVDIEFTFPNSSPISSIEIISQINGGAKVTRKGRWNPIKTTYTFSYDDYPKMVMWPTMQFTDNSNKTAEQVMASAVSGTFIYRITEFSAEADDYEALFSGTFIPKDKLLSTSYSPAEFLISYCKLFGLYFYRDPAEQSDDPELCPRGVIHIMDRDTFFTGDYVDLQERIDRSKDMTIGPTMAASKWYSFDLEPIEGDAEKAYKSTYGYNYGRQLVNTNYNFDHNTTSLYDGNVFKSGIMVREKDKYFCRNYRRNPRYRGSVPHFALNGFKNTLFHITSGDMETYEYEVSPIGVQTGDINNFELKRYDAIPKLQCHSENNEAVDGDGVLLFFRGSASTVNYYITDDIFEMQTLNGGNACWLMMTDRHNANGQEIGISMSALPMFTRDFVLVDYTDENIQEGNIVNSWNFGHPQATFVPNVYTTEGDSIYDKCWKNYIGDMYNQNGKKLTCFVNLQGIPTNEWLRRWYWFDNSVWRLNEIKEWNAADPSTTQCEFIKVQNTNNYHLNSIYKQGLIEINLDQDTIGSSGGTINGSIYLQSGRHWYSVDGSGVITGRNTLGQLFYSEGALVPFTGSGITTQITVTFPPSSSETPITWTIAVEDDWRQVAKTYVVQDGNNSAIINITEDSATLPATGGTAVLHYTSQNIVDQSIGVTVNGNWASATANTNTKVITVTASTWTGTTQRSTTLTITGTGTDNTTHSDSCIIYQNAFGELTLVGTPVYFDYDEGTATTKTFTVSGDTTMTWEITSLNDEQ